MFQESEVVVVLIGWQLVGKQRKSEGSDGPSERNARLEGTIGE